MTTRNMSFRLCECLAVLLATAFPLQADKVFRTIPAAEDVLPARAAEARVLMQAIVAMEKVEPFKYAMAALFLDQDRERANAAVVQHLADLRHSSWQAMEKKLKGKTQNPRLDLSLPGTLYRDELERIQGLVSAKGLRLASMLASRYHPASYAPVRPERHPMAVIDSASQASVGW